MQSIPMIRTGLIAALTVALLSGTAMAIPSNTSTASAASSTPVANTEDRTDAPPPTPPSQSASRDLFCRRDAAARTGYVSPNQAARHEQAAGTVGGTLGGAALGAVIGGATGHAGTGAAIGAGAGLIAGTAIGADNARQAANDTEHRYAEAYYACLGEADGAPNPPPAYVYDFPPPPPYYYEPYPYPYYYPRYYYGPAVTLSLGYHGRHHW